MSDAKLKPGWLADDVAKAVARIAEWGPRLPRAPLGVVPGSEFEVDGVACFVITATDYARLCESALGGDDMLFQCENCEAWLDHEDPAAAHLEDVSLCWAAATCRERDSHMCRRHRVSEIAKKIMARPLSPNTDSKER